MIRLLDTFIVYSQADFLGDASKCKLYRLLLILLLWYSQT